LLAISFVKRINQLCFQLGRKPYSRLITPSEDSHGRSLWKRETIHDDLAANYGA